MQLLVQYNTHLLRERQAHTAKRVPDALALARVHDVVGREPQRRPRHDRRERAPGDERVAPEPHCLDVAHRDNRERERLSVQESRELGEERLFRAVAVEHVRRAERGEQRGVVQGRGRDDGGVSGDAGELDSCGTAGG